MDNECGVFFHQHLADAVSNGTVTREMMNNALFNLFDVRFRIGEFDPLNYTIYSKIGASTINSQAHQILALEGAQQAAILLKNEANALPLTPDLTVALIGPHAKATVAMQGNYAETAPFYISPLEGMRKYNQKVSYSQGCDVACESTSGFQDAINAAKNADVAVIIVGIDQSLESEGTDRVHLNLPGHQDELVAQVANTANRTVVVLMSGGPVDIQAIKDNSKVHSILVMGYPGEQGGQGLADNLYGIVNPSGRLTTTVYPEKFTDVSMFTMDMRPNSTIGYPGRTYKFYNGGDEVYKFGEGLSYTTFQLTPLTERVVLVAETVENALTLFPNEHMAFISVSVKNTGERAGANTVLAFAVIPDPNPSDPIKSLFGFEKVFLQPGESKTVDFPISAKVMTVVNESGKRRVVRGKWKVSIGVPEDAVVAVEVVKTENNSS